MHFLHWHNCSNCCTDWHYPDVARNSRACQKGSFQHANKGNENWEVKSPCKSVKLHPYSFLLISAVSFSSKAAEHFMSVTDSEGEGKGLPLWIWSCSQIQQHFLPQFGYLTTAHACHRHWKWHTCCLPTRENAGWYYELLCWTNSW